MTSTRIARTAVVAGAVGVVVLTGAGTASAESQVAEPATFTSAFTVMATPEMVVDADSAPAPGQPGAWGAFMYRINSDLDVLCYDISITGVTPPYQSPAKTATHIHEAAAGKAGPPRISLPDPVDNGRGRMVSSGCLQGPFTTGLAPTGTDTGDGFTLAQIEADPSAFSTDVHTTAFPAGAIRGQLSQVPTGGVETGAGGTADDSSSGAPLAALGGSLALAGAAAVAVRRRAVRS